MLDAVKRWWGARFGAKQEAAAEEQREVKRQARTRPPRIPRTAKAEAKRLANIARKRRIKKRSAVRGVLWASNHRGTYMRPETIQHKAEYRRLRYALAMLRKERTHLGEDLTGALRLRAPYLTQQDANAAKRARRARARAS